MSAAVLPHGMISTALILSGLASECAPALLQAVRDVARGRYAVLDIGLLTRGFGQPEWTAGHTWKAHDLAAIADACLRIGDDITVRGMEAGRIFLNVRGSGYTLETGFSGHLDAVAQAIAVDGYGSMPVIRLCRCEWGGGYAGGNVNATKCVVASWNAGAAIRYMLADQGIELP